MQLTRAVALAVTAAFLVTLLVGTSAPSQAAAPHHRATEMSTTRAGKYYLKAVCAIGPAYRHFNNRVFGSRDTITLTEIKGRLPELRVLSRDLGRALQIEARQLYNPPSAWPDGVENGAVHIATAAARESTFRGAQDYAQTAQEWARYNGKANRVDYGPWPTIVRSRLGLPGPGKGC